MEVVIEIETKNCNKCKADVPVDQFRERTDKRTGVKYTVNTCRGCENKAAKEYFAKVRTSPVFIEKNKERSNNYRLANAETIKEKRKLTHTVKSVKYQQWRKEYTAKNREKIRAQEAITKKRFHEKQRDNLTDEYIIKLLVNYGWERKFILANPDLIIKHREKIQAVRAKRLARTGSAKVHRKHKAVKKPAMKKKTIQAEPVPHSPILEGDSYRFIDVPYVFRKYKKVTARILVLIDEQKASASVYSGKEFIMIDEVQLKNLQLL